MSISKPLTTAERGHMGARTRWTDHGAENRRVVRLHDLTPEQRGLVLALVASLRAAPKPAPKGKADR